MCVGVASVCACRGASPGFEGRGQVRRQGFPRHCHWLSESGSEEMTGRFQLLSGSSPCGGAWYRREFLWRELLGRIYTNTHTHIKTHRELISSHCANIDTRTRFKCVETHQRQTFCGFLWFLPDQNSRQWLPPAHTQARSHKNTQTVGLKIKLTAF